MTTSDNSTRAVLMAAVLLVAVSRLVESQAAALLRASDAGGTYRIAGTIVSKTDGHPLTDARVTIRDTRHSDKFDFVITVEDGRFEFHGLPAGKYSLTGAKRGFITAAYDQHDEFSTAIVTGAGLDTEHFVLKLAPDAVLSGKVLDETGEPVRHASVSLYFNDHTQGVDQIHMGRGAQTDDLGVYEMTSLRPGTYFLSANAKPWYAIHPQLEPSNSQAGGSPEAAQNVDRSLDVAYPVTYYPDVTDTESAMPIPIQGGEHMQVDIHLNPVPALHLKFRVPGDDKIGYRWPQLQQSAFDSATFVRTDDMRMISPGVMELSGVPAGRYNIQVPGPDGGGQINGVDLAKDGEEIDTSTAEASSSLKVSVHIPGETTIPKQLGVSLRSGSHMSGAFKMVDAKGEADFQNIPAGRYELLIVSFIGGKSYSIANISAEGAEAAGHSVTLTPGSSPSVSLRLVTGTAVVDGIAKKAGKAIAGAMVVLVPSNPADNRNLFRRDQTDLDGTFALHNVIPGSYTVVAIENGWDIDWSQPEVIAAYAKRGQTIEVGDQRTQHLNLAGPVEVQAK